MLYRRPVRSVALMSELMPPLTLLPVEREFVGLLADAEKLPDLLRGLAAEGKPHMMDGDDLPEATLRRLEAWAVHEYRGSLRLLRDADAAFSTEVLVRALLEFYAHVAWIHEGLPADAGRSQRTRAACLELGIAVEANDALTRKLTGWGAVDSRANAAAKERLTDIQSFHAAEGCSCKGHKWTDVQPMLKQLQSQGITWPYGLWVISSAAAHQLLPGRVEIDLGDGTSDFLGVAPYAWRATLLDYVVRTFGLAGVRVLDMVQPQHAELLRQWIETFVADRRMTDAACGKFDVAAITQMDGLMSAIRQRDRTAKADST